ncbi:hypothetical protein ABN584_12465 [Gloeocapsa sp. BRSZ]|uniref:hypothetical protein n=1 Tax=Gloeocapsa sp. PCC 7428 TaxID=1173026 RepID=UPI0002A5F347|nr:hypothetical protein [Gloeocapsa sp. PCC 7428]AFZ31743.1 hypothetical protein Glo7428_3257 [Gloeocapsa sp. PCC 7428]
MNFIDCALLTLFNAGVCLTLPKLLSIATTPKTRTQSPQKLAVQEVAVNVPVPN